ncbi:MAG: hypothetical protein QMD61_09220 [Methanobacterium sp.]|nr:hypothetical protein [Methanobacterium sp.]
MGKLAEKLKKKYCPECETETDHIVEVVECSECKNKDCIFICTECIKKELK